MTDTRDLIQAFLTSGAEALASTTHAGAIPATLAALIPVVEQVIAAAHGSAPVALEVVYNDHKGTRLASEAPDLHRAQVAALGKGG